MVTVSPEGRREIGTPASNWIKSNLHCTFDSLCVQRLQDAPTWCTQLPSMPLLSSGFLKGYDYSRLVFHGSDWWCNMEYEKDLDVLEFLSRTSWHSRFLRHRWDSELYHDKSSNGREVLMEISRIGNFCDGVVHYMLTGSSSDADFRNICCNYGNTHQTQSIPFWTSPTSQWSQTKERCVLRRAK